MLLRYEAREWFRLRQGLELWEVPEADLYRYQVCREAAEQLTRPATKK